MLPKVSDVLLTSQLFDIINDCMFSISETINRSIDEIGAYDFLKDNTDPITDILIMLTDEIETKLMEKHIL